jgi:hypothetical protein
MTIDEFEGHIVQIDYKDNKIRALHLDGWARNEVVKLVVHIEPSEAESSEAEAALMDGVRNGSLAFFRYDTRPKVTISWDA